MVVFDRACGSSRILLVSFPFFFLFLRLRFPGHPLRDKDLDLLGTSSFPAHARGDAFALSRQVVLDLSTVADVNPRGLRMFTDESISGGCLAWRTVLEGV